MQDICNMKLTVSYEMKIQMSRVRTGDASPNMHKFQTVQTCGFYAK